ncbi:uncharacterized protein LOC127131328 [Lathyrus oleraceus]|uniref:uncharacterized protein LOC127131328 n=1 Tax=Pisum sativum TaxID=3888 RepID=UPI0021D27947|nr:uncharacterized protein LOC127131328 [Pisum sativum]
MEMEHGGCHEFLRLRFEMDISSILALAIIQNYQRDNPDPTSPNHEDLQATIDSEKNPYVPEPIPKPSEPIPEPSEPIPEPFEPNLTLPTFDEALAKFLESSNSRFKKLSDESNTSDNPSEGLSEEVINDFIRGVEEKQEARLAKEAAEKAEQEAAEKATEEAAAREATEKAVVEAASREKVEAEAALAAEVTQKVTEDVEKTTEVALAQEDSSITDLAPLVIKTLEELHKE